jgi:hypothetical protein
MRSFGYLTCWLRPLAPTLVRFAAQARKGSGRR